MELLADDVAFSDPTTEIFCEDFENALLEFSKNPHLEGNFSADHLSEAARNQMGRILRIKESVALRLLQLFESAATAVENAFPGTANTREVPDVQYAIHLQKRADTLRGLLALPTAVLS